MEDYMSLVEAAVYLGVHPMFVKQLMEGGVLTCYRLGRSRYFLREDVVQWSRISSGKFRPVLVPAPRPSYL